MRCDYFDAGRCRSCALLGTPYAQQLQDKQRFCTETLPQIDAAAWLEPVASPEQGFRNRVKLVAGGETGRLSFGILDDHQRGVDLRECAIQAPEIARAIPLIAEVLNASGLPPYAVPERRGELKFVHLMVSPDHELMVRVVGRTQRTLDVVRSRLAELCERLPEAVLISVNLLPEHRAALEGEREEVLYGQSLRMRLSDDGGLALHVLPQSFFQTNTPVTRRLYARVSQWAVESAPETVWDLYCGVGGFALHCASAAIHAHAGGDASDNGASLTAFGEIARWGADRGNPESRLAPAATPPMWCVGVEVSEAAVRSAERSAHEAGLAARFIAQDATAFALESRPEDRPDVVIVNPPRRGIGETLANWLEHSQIERVIYSSCNPVSLAKDLAAMPTYRVVAAQAFDMFPHTAHLEVAVLLERVS